jgi:hypothetical protein
VTAGAAFESRAGPVLLAHISAEFAKDCRCFTVEVLGDEADGVAAFNAGEYLFALRTR